MSEADGQVRVNSPSRVSSTHRNSLRVTTGGSAVFQTFRKVHVQRTRVRTMLKGQVTRTAIVAHRKIDPGRAVQAPNAHSALSFVQ